MGNTLLYTPRPLRLMVKRGTMRQTIYLDITICDPEVLEG